MKPLQITNLRVSQYTSHLMALGARSQRNEQVTVFDELVSQSRVASHIHGVTKEHHRGVLLDHARMRFDALTDPRVLFGTIADSRRALNEIATASVVFPVKVTENGSVNWRVPVDQLLDAIYHALGSDISDESNIYPQAILDGLSQYEEEGNTLSPIERAFFQHADAVLSALNAFFDLPEDQVELLINARLAIGNAEEEYAKHLEAA